jgi:hypothetical protein
LNGIDFGAKALWTLVPASSIATLAALAVFRRLSDAAQFRRSANRIVAHLYELRLFLDEPVLVFRAQSDLVRENLRLLRIVALPSAILVLPFGLLFVEMNAFYGHAPLVVDQPAIVTVQFTRSPTESMPEVQLIRPDGVEVETPPVRVLATNQVSWRIRPGRALSGELQFQVNGAALTKSISAGAGVHYLPERKMVKFPFNNSAVAWIEIEYPTARICGFPWLAWFVLASAVTALAYQFYT